MKKSLEELRDVSFCPLCGDSGSDAVSQPRANLYSEQLALLLDCDESALLEAVCNRRCATCGLWYKARWFEAEALQKLFGECIPDHPKGWDAVSGRFSEAGFADAMTAFQRAVQVGSVHEQARWQRTLVSIIDSVRGIDAEGLRQRFLDAIEAGDLATLGVLAPQLKGRFAVPVAFKRFSGFSSSLLWGWMESHIGTIERYGEVGCPLWGQLTRPLAADTHRCYFDRPETNYWGGGCRRNGRHCSQRLASQSEVEVRPWPPGSEVHWDAIGAFQYLDHLEAPNAFVAEVFEHSRALLLILDDGDAPSAIQHVSGWNERSVAWLAQAHGKQVRSDFALILGSGNRAWLLCDD